MTLLRVTVCLSNVDKLSTSLRTQKIEILVASFTKQYGSLKNLYVN